MILEPGQLSILAEMGIPVWALRQHQDNLTLQIDVQSSVEKMHRIEPMDWLIMVDEYNQLQQNLLGNMLFAIGYDLERVTIVGTEDLQSLEQLTPSKHLLLAFGQRSIQILFGQDAKLEQYRGKTHQLFASQLTTIVSHGLQDLLMFPEKKMQAWQDLKFARLTYQQLQHD